LLFAYLPAAAPPNPPAAGPGRTCLTAPQFHCLTVIIWPSPDPRSCAAQTHTQRRSDALLDLPRHDTARLSGNIAHITSHTTPHDITQTQHTSHRRSSLRLVSSRLITSHHTTPHHGPIASKHNTERSPKYNIFEGQRKGVTSGRASTTRIFITTRTATKKTDTETGATRTRRTPKQTIRVDMLPIALPGESTKRT
jgi:hypothetical protein